MELDVSAREEGPRYGVDGYHDDARDVIHRFLGEVMEEPDGGFAKEPRDLRSQLREYLAEMKRRARIGPPVTGAVADNRVLRRRCCFLPTR